MTLIYYFDINGYNEHKKRGTFLSLLSNHDHFTQLPFCFPPLSHQGQGTRQRGIFRFVPPWYNQDLRTVSPAYSASASSCRLVYDLPGNDFLYHHFLQSNEWKDSAVYSFHQRSYVFSLSASGSPSYVYVVLDMHQSMIYNIYGAYDAPINMNDTCLAINCQESWEKAGRYQEKKSVSAAKALSMAWTTRDNASRQGYLMLNCTQCCLTVQGVPNKQRWQR